MRNKWIYTIIVLALGLFASCSDNIDEAGTTGKSRKVVFRLSVNDASVGSRAAWSESYTTSDAEGIENYINPNTLQVVVYEGTTYRGKATNVLSWPATDGDAEYQFVGDISHLNLVPDNSYQFMVLANCADVSRTTQLSRLPYDISDLQNAIPMCGVIKKSLNDNELQDLGTIDLLRAAAKIEVDLKVDLDGNQEDNSPMKEYTLETVSIKPYNTRGYCAPSGVNSNVESTTALDQEGCFNPHTSLAEDAEGHKSLPFTVSPDGKRAFVYVPEYDNKHTSSHAATISVTLKKGSDTYLYEDAIVFYQYNNGSPLVSVENEYNIIRNHHYKFTVTGVSGGLLIKYAVNDWVYDEDTHKTDWGYDYPTYHNPLLPEIPDDDEITQSPEMYYKLDGSGNISEDGAFVAYFQMTTGSQNWIPTIIGGSLEDYFIKVYKLSDVNEGEAIYDSSEQNPTTSNLVAYDGWYKIKVIAKKPKDELPQDQQAKLGITYSLSTTSTSYYLLINGTSDTDIRWPSSGDDPRFINITQTADQ